MSKRHVHRKALDKGEQTVRDTDLSPSCQPVSKLSQHIHVLNQKRVAEGLPRILVHTDAAQMIGKGRVDVQELGVDYLTIVGHKVQHCSRGPVAFADIPAGGTLGGSHSMARAGQLQRAFGRSLRGCESPR